MQIGSLVKLNASIARGIFRYRDVPVGQSGVVIEVDPTGLDRGLVLFPQKPMWVFFHDLELV